MKTSFSCEVCGGDDWHVLGKRTYGQEDLVQASIYERKRFLVLFETWFPGRDEVELASLGCCNCGFVCYSPRPDSADIDAKYRKLAELGQDYGKTEQPEIATRRSETITRVVRRYLAKATGDVLDYGGGDGRLMQSFQTSGFECYLLDYNEHPLPTVTKIGNTLGDLEPQRKFHAIIANHVIEHVAEPGKVLANLAKHLHLGGVLFVEVPMEIWRKAPLQSEPVTHINFFVPGSMRRALEEAGLLVRYCELTTYLHPTGRLLPAVRAVAIKAPSPPSPKSSGWKEVESFLNPRFPTRLHRNWKLREKWAERLKAKLWRAPVSGPQP